MIDISLLIEHYLKMELSSTINLDPHEDGVCIVDNLDFHGMIFDIENNDCILKPTPHF